jgi:hypothetical protein
MAPGSFLYISKEWLDRIDKEILLSRAEDCIFSLLGGDPP